MQDNTGHYDNTGDNNSMEVDESPVGTFTEYALELSKQFSDAQVGLYLKQGPLKFCRILWINIAFYIQL